MSESIPEIELTVGLRGYDRQQVDALVERISSGAVTAIEARAAAESLDVVLRGYDKEEVDELMRLLIADLDGSG